ncbi:MAG TPA: M28 family peptidase [Candidatus Acidoferrales bacterium]|nr:M28 family peptidase [Candidatus Acidoferrales bacterium]
MKSPNKARSNSDGGIILTDEENEAQNGVHMLGGPRISLAVVALACVAGCGAGGNKANASTSGGVAASGPAIAPQDKAPSPQQTGGFDGQRAYDYTAKLVSFGPRPSGSDAIKKTQGYISGELHADGCQVDEDNFNAQTPVGNITMKNIVAKVPGAGKDVILLLTHYDTKRLDNFVGAEDGGSSTGLMLEMARLLCGKKQPVAIWMAFLDGEEAVNPEWGDDDHTYGSRQMAANLELTGQSKNVKAVILVDMIGQKGLHTPKESTSTAWLTELIWSTAAKLGYQNVFVSQSGPVDDDHDPFLAKGIPAVDIIDLNDYINEGYWHTPQDTMDKISPKSLAIVGHVVLASVGELEKKFSR